MEILIETDEGKNLGVSMKSRQSRSEQEDYD
jgi:hypothetical protein